MAPMHRLDSPFTANIIPTIDANTSSEINSIMREFLKTLERQPLSTKRSSVQRRGRRARKPRPTIRPRTRTQGPSVSAIEVSLTIGFNSTTRHLEGLAARTKSGALLGKRGLEEGMPVHLDVVFVAPLTHQLVSAHLPCLAQTASLAHPDLPQTKVAILNASSSSSLSKAMNVPRWSMLGVKHGSALASLLSGLVEVIPRIEPQWLDQAAKATYYGTNIDSAGPASTVGGMQKS